LKYLNSQNGCTLLEGQTIKALGHEQLGELLFKLQCSVGIQGTVTAVFFFPKKLQLYLAFVPHLLKAILLWGSICNRGKLKSKTKWALVHKLCARECPKSFYEIGIFSESDRFSKKISSLFTPSVDIYFS